MSKLTKKTVKAALPELFIGKDVVGSFQTTFRSVKTGLHSQGWL
jgi:hypothetical protein